MKFYSENIDTVLSDVQSAREGLSAAEAERRLAENGPNKLAEGKKDPLLKRFFKQMADPMIIILLAAALISFVVSLYSGESFADVIIILSVVIINAVLGVYQESKAEKAIEALQKMSASTNRVLRDGRVKIVKSEELVVGDVVLLEAGDAIPADGRLIESQSLKIEEAALTGESVPVSKFIDLINLGDGADVPLGDRENMVYMGSSAVYGRGAAVVVATGMDTEMGKIADALSAAEQGLTPLQIKLSQLSKILSRLVIGICVFIFALGIIRAGSFSGAVILDTFMVAVSLAVAAIPEGLVAVVTIVLSIGVTNMSKRNAIIRRLTAVETLGCAQIICSDKTGTLTQNKMTVVDWYGSNQELLATAMSLCSDAEEDAEGNAVGEPTECALVNYAHSLGLDKDELKACAPRVGEAPFDSMRKMMSTVHLSGGSVVQYTKGAPDVVLDKCVGYLDHDEIKPMTNDKRAEIVAANKSMADKALRVLAASVRYWTEQPEDTSPENLEQQLIFVGLTGMIDPVRPEVKAAIVECREAGIRPIMITGDHIDTATAIARELGILGEGQRAISGSELSAMSDADFAAHFQEFSVYARVQPEHKVRIVNAWRGAGFVTAMTGDGVNDAPSIKSADIGVGMGITGTDLLGSNMSEVLSILTATLLGFTILEPAHLLWINLITDCFPALALGLEKAEGSIMKRPPRSATDGVFAGGMGFDVAYQGVIITLVTLAAYLIGHFMEAGVWVFTDSADGMTMAFLTLSMAEIFHSFNMRSQRGSLFTLKGWNKALNWAGLASLLCTTLVIEVPFLANAFGFEAISMAEYGVALALAFCVIPLVELVKLIQRAVAKNKA